MTVVDYGCGPRPYTVAFARLVGPAGRVYAVDVQAMAVDAARRKAERQGLSSIVPALAHGCDCGLRDGIADMIFAIDMFFTVREPAVFLRELKRIACPDGILVIDDGYQSRSATLAKLQVSRLWVIEEKTRNHLVCRPASSCGPHGGLLGCSKRY